MRARPGTVTIYDVAARAGVSISTVSLVVNAPHRVTPATRERVVAAAMALGYRMTAGRRIGATRIAVARTLICGGTAALTAAFTYSGYVTVDPLTK